MSLALRYQQNLDNWLNKTGTKKGRKNIGKSGSYSSRVYIIYSRRPYICRTCQNMYKKETEKEQKSNQKIQKINEISLDNTHYRVTQITPWGEIKHYFHTEDFKGACKLLMYLNNRKMRYETNTLLQEFIDEIKYM